MPGRGSSALISATMSTRSSSSTRANPPQRHEIAAGQQVEIGDKRRHRRVEAVARLELQRQAFGKVARKQAGRIEGLADGQHREDIAFRVRRAARRSRPARRADSRPRRARRPVRRQSAAPPGSAKAKLICSPAWSRSVRAATAKSSRSKPSAEPDCEPVAGRRFPLRREIGTDRLRRAGLVGIDVLQRGIEFAGDRAGVEAAIVLGEPVRVFRGCLASPRLAASTARFVARARPVPAAGSARFPRRRSGRARNASAAAAGSTASAAASSPGTATGAAVVWPQATWSVTERPETHSAAGFPARIF